MRSISGTDVNSHSTLSLKNELILGSLSGSYSGCIKQGSGWPLYKGQEGTSSNCSPPSIQVPTEEEDSSRMETHSKNANHKPRKLSRSHDANQCYEMYVCMYDLDMQYPRSSSHI